MTEQEIERCLERFATCKATDVMNFDYAGTLEYIQRLKAENEALKERCQFNVGDTIWYLFGYEEVQPWEIQSIVILKDRYILRLGHEGTDDYNAVLSKYYGEDWFATKEECEKKAKEYKENKNDD